MALVYLVWGLIGGVLAVTFAAIAGTIIALPLVVIPRGRRERWSIYAGVVFGWLSLKLAFLLRLKVEGAERLPPRPYLVVSNHRSWVDPVIHVVYALTQGLSKAEIAYLPVIGQYAYLTGAIYFSRKERAARRRAFHEALMLLHGGAGVFVFPEGTRTRDGNIREKVHLKLVEACFEEGIPVIPAAVMHTERALPVGVYGIVPFQRAYVRYLPPLRPEDHPDAESYAREAWRQVIEAAGEMQRSCP